MKKVLAVFLLALPLSTAAQIYKTTDADGNVIFTDNPAASGSSAERVELHQTNTAAPPPERPVAAPVELIGEDEPEIIEYSASINSPANETTIAMGPGNFSLSATITPGIAEGMSLQLNMDGAPRGGPQTAPTWNLTNVFRGAHDLTVSVIDESGEVVATSQAVRVYVLRPSINN